MSRAPKNIERSLAQNSAIEAATAYSNSLREGNIKAQWFENDSKRLEHMAGQPPKSTARIDTKQELKDAGMRSGIEAVKLRRQERLKELYEAEQLQYERELNAMGLSLVKPVD